MNFLSPHVLKRAFAYFLLPLLGFRVGSPLFGIPFVKPFPFVNLSFSMSMFRCGLWASSGPFPLSAHYGLYKRGRDPLTNPSRHLKKERSVLPLKWLIKEDQGRRPTADAVATGHRRSRYHRIDVLPSSPLHGPLLLPPPPLFPPPPSTLPFAAHHLPPCEPAISPLTSFPTPLQNFPSCIPAAPHTRCPSPSQSRIIP